MVSPKDQREAKSIEQSSLITFLHRVSAASKQFNWWVQLPVLVSRWY